MSTLRTDTLQTTNSLVTIQVADIISAGTLNQSGPNDGASLLGKGVVAVPSLLDLSAIRKDATQIYEVKGFYAGSFVGGGRFVWSPSTAKSLHNGWRVVDPVTLAAWNGTPATLSTYLNTVGPAGNGVFVRIGGSTANPEMAGALSDWDGTNGTDASASFKALIKDTTVNELVGSGKTYWFGNFAANELKFPVTRTIKMRWGWSKFIGRGEASVNDFAASLFFYDDAQADIGEFTFDDLSYSENIAGRGIQAVTIVSRLKSTRGHEIGPCHIERGQSILTCAPMASNNFRSSNIRFRGEVTFGQVYYGINLADNGDDFMGNYSGNRVIRSIFVFGVSDVDANIKATSTVPASASVLISQNVGSRPTENITVKAHFGEINGPILIASVATTNGTGIFRNIDLNITVDTLGANMAASNPVVRAGCYDNNDLLITELRTWTTDNIRLSLKLGPSVPFLVQPILIYTPSANHGKWFLAEDFPFEAFGLSPVDAAGNFNTPTFVRGGRVFKCVTGDLTSSTRKVTIAAKYFVSRLANQDINTIIRITARNGLGAGTACKIEEKAILAYIDSTGLITLKAQSSTAILPFGTPTSTFTVTTSADFRSLVISADGYTNASSTLTVSFTYP